MFRSLRRNQTRFQTWLASACTGVSLVAVFTIPYHIPVRRTFSSSYLFGYNNHAGIVLVVIFALVAATFLPIAAAVPTSGKPLTPATLSKALMITLVAGTTLVLLTWRIDGFIESVYTVDRTRLLVEGHAPFREFEFSYGLLGLYGPAFLSRTLHVSIPAACELFFLAACLLGVWQLYMILAWSGFPPAQQRNAFLTMLILFFPAMIATSTAYTLPRFLTGGLLALLSQRLLARETERDHILALLLPIPGIGLTLLLSPEMGVAYAGGIALYLLRFGHLRRPLYLAAYTLMLAGAAGVLLAARREGAFLTLAAFSRGGLNFPIIPAPHILLFLVSIAISSAFCVRLLRRGDSHPALALASVALAMLPAALGRCDPGHVLFDGIFFLIIALLVCCTDTRRSRLLLPAALIFVFFLLPFVRGIRGFVSTMTLLSLPNFLQGNAQTAQAALVERLTLRIWGPVKGPINFERMRSRQTNAQTIDLPAIFGLPASTVFAAPFGFFGGHTGPYHTPAIDEGYFLSVINMVTPEEVARKIAELDRHPERPLLLPAGAESSCLVDPDGARAEIEALFAYPYRVAAVHADNVMEPLCIFIRSRYRLVQPATAAHFGEALWERGPTSSSTEGTNLLHEARPKLIR